MAGLFSKRKGGGKTILIVDIESGSVGCALVRVAKGQGPKLFAESRTALPVFATRDSALLLKEVEKALHSSLLHASTAAARMRNHETLAPLGDIAHAAVFVSPPWVSASIEKGSLKWDFEIELKKTVITALRDILGTKDIAFNAAGVATAHATNVLFGDAHGLLVCTVGGEVAELIFVEDGVVGAHATMPIGKHFILRTLRSHAGLSEAEAHSALVLSRKTGSTHADHAFSAAADHFARTFADTARKIESSTPVQGILVIGHEPVGAWAARQLAGHDSLASLFSEDTTVQALHTHHLMPYLAAHAAKPDVTHMLETIFVSHYFTDRM